MLESGAFLGALAAVAAIRGGELLLDLIVSDDAAPHGAYTFQFFKHGCWQAVVVDNFLPCVSGEVGARGGRGAVGEGRGGGGVDGHDGEVRVGRLGLRCCRNFHRLL